MSKSSAHRQLSVHGFSLVEVVLALGVFAFVLVALIGLLPRGMQSNREAREETEAMGLMLHLVAERRALPFTNGTSNGLPPLDSIPPMTSRVETNSTDLAWGDRRYRVQYVLQRPPVISDAVSRTAPYLFFLRVSWPADTTNSQGSVESLASFTAP